MRSLPRLTAAAAGLAAALVLIGPAAWAAPSGRINEMTPTPDGGLQILFSATDLPAGVAIDPASVKVSIGGTPATAVARPVTQAPEPISRTALLVIDTSGSMNQDGKLAAAQAAAKAFIDTVPADVKVGILTFNDTISVPAAPTTNHAALLRIVGGLKANGGTKLYDAVLRAIDVLGSGASRTAVLLTDGADDGSKATLAEAVSAVAASGISLQAVALGAGAQTAVLQQMASAAKGSVISAGKAADVAAAFVQAARTITNQVVVEVSVPPARAGQSADVTVSLTAGAVTLTDTAFTLLPAPASTTSTAVPEQYGPQPVQLATGPSWLTNATLPLVFVALFLGLAGLLAVAVLGATRSESRESRVRRRLSIYTLTGRRPVRRQQVETALGTSQVARSAVELAGKVVARRDLEALLGRRLEAAGLPLKAAEWLLIHVGIALAVPLLLLLLSGGNIVLVLTGAALGAILPWIYLSVKEQRRLASFLDQLPNTLQLLAGSLSAGYSFQQAMDTVVREGQAPMTVEFNRALVESRLGVPVEDALDGIAERMKSVDFEWVVMAIRIQREVGGNLSEVLTTVAHTLREREQVRRQVRVLSAEGRLSGWIIGAMPPLFALFLFTFRFEYLKPLITTPLGLVMISVGLVLEVVGVVLISRIVKVEV